MSLSRVLKFSRRIEFKLTFWYAVIFIISWLGLFFAGFTILENSVLSRDRYIVTGLMDHYVLVARTKGIDLLLKELEIDKLVHMAGGRLVMVADRNGEILHMTLPYGWSSLDDEEIQNLLFYAPDGTWHYLETKRYADDPKDMAGRDELEFRVKELSGKKRLWMGHSAEFREEYLESFRDLFFLVMLMVVLLSVAVGLFMAWRSMAPVRVLEKTVTRVMAGRMEARIPLTGREGEISELSEQFNKMLDRIEGLIKAMGEALDNVAHDLRTPLTRMGIAIERNAMEEDPEKLREALFDCAEESQRISGMLTTLMDISEAETGAMALNFIQVDLAALFDEVIDIYEYAAEDKGISLVASTSRALTLTADVDRLRQVMCNLVDNAIKYSPAGTQVDLAAHITGETLEISVADSGMGISPEESEKIFDRLYRCDHSRKTKGSGLGLSLVKAVIQAHKGRVSVQSSLEKGTVFLISFPLPKV